MPALAGPYQTLNFSGNLTNGSATVTGIIDIGELAVGDYVTGTGIPAGTTILSVNTAADSIMLSANATAGGLQSSIAANPSAAADPDLLMAATYGEGEFAINLAPIVFPGTVASTRPTRPGTATDGTTLVKPPRRPSTA